MTLADYLKIATHLAQARGVANSEAVELIHRLAATRRQGIYSTQVPLNLLEMIDTLTRQQKERAHAA